MAKIINPEMLDEIVDLYKSGKSCKAISKKYYGISGDTIGRILKKNDVKLRTSIELLVENSFAKSVDRQHLKKLVDCGKSLVDMSKEFKVSPLTVSKACKKLKIKYLNHREQVRNKTANKIPSNLFVGKLNKRLSWVLGLIATDGCVSGSRVQITSKDYEVLSRVKDYLKMGTIQKSTVNSGYIYVYRVSSVYLVERLLQYNIVPRKSRILQFPKKNKIIASDFIRGCWEGDGSWGIDKRNNHLICSFVSASKGFISCLHRNLKPITLSNSNICHYPERDYWTIAYAGNSAVRLAKWLYNDLSGGYMERKYNIVKPYLQLQS